MKLIHYLSLYLDSFKRFSSSQLFYWLLNKYIKKLVPIKFYMGRLDKNDMLPFDTLKSRLNYSLILNRPLSHSNANYNNNFNLIHHYFNDVNELFVACDKYTNKNEVESFWNVIEIQTDLEIQNNYQRFYYFSETIEINNLNPEFAVALIDKWIDKYPPLKDISWNSFNCTIRLINWFKILGKLPEEYNIDPKLWSKIQISIYKQIKYISSHIEYHIPGNHVIIQFYLLWLVSVVFPDWNKTIKKIVSAECLFKQELQNEFLKNGFHFEHSYHYHVQIVLFGMMWLVGMKNLNKFIEEDVKTILKNAALLLEEFINPNGYLPMLGDNCFCFLSRNLYEDIELFKILKPIAFAGVLQEVKSKNVLDINDLYVLASSFESRIIFDVGNIGLTKNPGHGHSDLLSLIYLFKGHPIFIDPGTRKYSMDHTSLDLKKSLSHNTISIAGNDQAKLWGFFRWAYLPNNLSNEYYTNNDEIILSGEYYGFRHIGGITHKRTLQLSNQNLTISDSLIGKGKHNIYINFILHPNIEIENEEEIFLLVHRELKLKFDICSDYNYEVLINSFNIYPSYDVAVSSKRLQVRFNNVTPPFSSKIMINEL